jgi:putative ABC transport system ATP-binding protein
MTYDGTTTALRNLSLDVAPGEIVAVTGRSGSGKSTLLHCLAGIITPGTGEVHYAGRRLDNRPEAERTLLRRTDFGVLFQFGQLVPELTAAENTALPLLLQGVRRHQARAEAVGWLDRLGVADTADARPGQLSGGQAQRVALARALVTGPKVVFADEPTGALDSYAGEKVLTALLAAVRPTGAAVVLVTHDATVAAYADREVVLRDGSLADANAGSLT